MQSVFPGPAQFGGASEKVTLDNAALFLTTGSTLDKKRRFKKLDTLSGTDETASGRERRATHGSGGADRWP